MAGKAVVSLTTGLEDPEQVTVALLVAVGAAEAGRPTLMFMAKEAVRLALGGVATGVACDGCPSIADLIDRYAVRRTDALLKAELAVIGGDWGANAYTTRAQADRLVDALALRPGDRLLDLGAGRGWPGLYLAHESGCDVVLTDVPLAALR